MPRTLLVALSAVLAFSAIPAGAQSASPGTPTGSVEHRTIYSYRGRDSTYIVTAVLATGQVWTYHGRPDGDRWTFDLQSDRPNNPQRLRMILTVAGDTIHFVEESSEHGGPWQVTEDYRHVRVSRIP